LAPVVALVGTPSLSTEAHARRRAAWRTKHGIIRHSPAVSQTAPAHTVSSATSVDAVLSSCLRSIVLFSAICLEPIEHTTYNCSTMTVHSACVSPVWSCIQRSRGRRLISMTASPSPTWEQTPANWARRSLAASLRDNTRYEPSTLRCVLSHPQEHGCRMSLHESCAWIWMGKFRHVHRKVLQIRFLEEFIASSSSFVNHKICIR
jgi:hypothetical protein